MKNTLIRLGVSRVLASLALSVSLTSVAATPEQQLLLDIKNAEKALVQTQEQVTSERRQLGKAIFTATNRIEKMREEAAIAQRVLDEQTLSLSSLETRLNQWQEQSQYQQHLLTQFLRDANTAPTTTFDEQLAALENIANKVSASLTPNWKNERLVQQSGQIVDAQLLPLGPVTLYRQHEIVGIAELENQSWRARFAYPDTVAQSWNSTSGNALLMFDPSQSRALAQVQAQESVLQHLTKGGIWVLPILAFAIFAVLIAVYKALQFWRLPSLPNIAALPLLQAQPTRFKEAGMADELLNVWMTFAPGQQRDDQLYNALLNARAKLERFVGAVAITASVAPLLGLLGTVSGMIDTFKMMTLFGAGDPQVVSGGISQALITTELGLVVAIPALIGHALLNRKAKTYYQQLESIALCLSQQPNQENEQRLAA